ncbi:MAG: restriction endonuclease subunit S, partial [Elusimicrobiota bacterium]|nr:restriction endonuclease subunit S [Elusimicrobiota bacterium]
GIVFNDDNNAYKNLRKMLIDDNFLYAVISLPSGVFKPYSGQKTSILLIDKQMTKQLQEILFINVENDGFDLGAQRRPINENDLPQALEIIREFQRTGKIPAKIKNARLVAKTEIAKDESYSLLSKRYEIEKKVKNIKFKEVSLSDVAEIASGNSAPQDLKLFENGKYPFIRTADVGAVHHSTNLTQICDYLNNNGIKGLKLFRKGTILFPKSGASTFLNHRVIMGVDGYVSSHLATISANENKILPLFLYYILIKIDAKKLTAEQSYPSLKISDLKKVKIPLPPLSIQKEIVAEIENKQAAIDNAKKLILSIERERESILDAYLKG